MTDQLNRDEIKRLVAEAVAESTERVLIRLGLDTENPKEMQRDMLYVRSQRQAAEHIGRATRVAMLTIFVTGACTLLWQGLKQAFH